MGNGGPQTAIRSQISNRPEMKEASKIPGPGNYDLKLRRGSPVWSIGKGDRTDHQARFQGKSTTAVGTYNPDFSKT